MSDDSGTVSDITGDVCKIFAPLVFNTPAENLNFKFFDGSGGRKNYNDAPTIM